VSLPAEAPAGFLGVAPQEGRERLGPVQAIGEAGTTFASTVKESVLGIGKLFSPSGIGDYFDTVTSASSDDDTSTDTAAIRPVESTAPNAPSAEPQNENRPLSILGIGRLGAQAFDSGPIAFLWLLVIVNIFLGLFNLLPLPPLDGGHAAIATYEVIREKISGRKYRVDIAKLMPLTYAVVLLLVVIGVTSIYLDIVDPVANPFGP
jgi:membrane-associated protease RseP (regulator of RpoE activity)